MLDLSFFRIRRLGGWLAAAVVSLCCAGAIPAQEDESAVALRDAEGYEVPAQGWVKAPSFLLDHLGDAFSPTVMDIAENAEFDDPTTWSLTEQGGEILKSFQLVGDYRSMHAPVIFSPDDKFIACIGLIYDFLYLVGDIQSGNIMKFYAGGAAPGGICFRHGIDEVIVWSREWAHHEVSANPWTSTIYVYDVQTQHKIKSIGNPYSYSIGDLYFNSIVPNIDGSRIYITTGVYIPPSVQKTGVTYVLDIDIGNVLRIYDSRIVNYLLSRTGTVMMIRNVDGTSDFLDTKTDEIIYTFTDLPSVRSIDTATGNANILMGFSDGAYALLNTEKASPIRPLDIPPDSNGNLRITGDGGRMGIVDSGHMHLWDLEMKKDFNFSASEFQEFSHNGEMYVTFTDTRAKHTDVHSMPPQIRYQSGDLTNGPRTLYVRLRDGEENNEVYTFHYNLDTAAPGRTGKPAAQGGQIDGRVKFSWPTAGDNAGGSGVANYEFIAESAAGACDEHRAFSGGEPRATIPCATGRMVHFRVRAIDLAGNAGEWSEPVAYYVNAAPEAPALTLSPASPVTLDRVAVRASSTDPEGDAIIDTGAQWYLDGVLQSSEVTLDPSLTARGQVWTCRARVRDFHGAWSDFSELTFTIGNTPPSQPIVEIKPDPARADSDLIVDVMQYSIDPDGDEVGYDFTWFKSVDGGGSWIHKVELDGLPQVSNLFINDGELWRVIYTPYEKESPADLTEADAKAGGKTPGLNRVEGFYAWDQVYVGGNQPPSFAFQSVRTAAESGGIGLDVTWTASDPDGDAVSVNLYYFDVDYPVWAPVQMFIGEEAGGWQGTLPVTGDMTFRLVAVVTDAKGSVTQVVSGEQSVKTAARPNWVIYR